MTDPLSALARQAYVATTSREALRCRAAKTVQRFAPARLSEDAAKLATDLVRETGAQIRQHPFAAAGAALGFIALLFHKPLGNLADQLIGARPPLTEKPQEDGKHPEPDHAGRVLWVDDSAAADGTMEQE
jgi:ElaB/YqjD/DUF883 family membrane-anchored ribosome-binding protein